MILGLLTPLRSNAAIFAVLLTGQSRHKRELLRGLSLSRPVHSWLVAVPYVGGDAFGLVRYPNRNSISRTAVAFGFCNPERYSSPIKGRRTQR